RVPFIAILATAAAVAAQAPARPVLPANGPGTFDIAGVKLGATPAAVRTALATSGYRIERTDMDLSFEQTSKAEADRLQHRAPTYLGDNRTPIRIVADGPNGETITVDFMAWPGSAVV